MFLKFWNHAFAVDHALFWNDWMKSVVDAILSYYMLYQNLSDRPTKHKPQCLYTIE